MVIRETLTATHVSQAIRLADAGTARLQEWADLREPGLRLRVRRYNATWLLKFRDRTITLGTALRWNIATAREMASHVRGMLRSGLDPRPWVDARLAGATAEEAAGVALRREARERQEWTVDDLMQHYLDDHIRAGRVVRGIRRPPSKNSALDVEFVLRTQPYAEIGGLLVRELDQRNLETFRDRVELAHGGSASRKALAYVRAALTWAKKKHAGQAGLVDGPRWWRDVSSLHVESTKDRMPTLEDIAMTIAVAEAAQRLPGRGIEAKARDATLAALWFLVLTAQRRETAVSVQKAHLLDDDRGDDGWGVVYFPPEAMKSRREHVLPLPPTVMEIMRPRLAATGSRWLFPASRQGRDGEEVHLSGSALNRLFARLRGRDQTGRDREVPDLLALAGVSVPDWSPHDVRRTFASLVEDWTTRGDAVSAVLDHEGFGAASTSAGIRSNVPGQAAAAITRTAYSRSQRLPLKRLAVEPWVDAVVAAVEAARPSADRIMADLKP